MNKKLKKTITAVLALSLTLSLFAGCGSKKKEVVNKATGGQTGDVKYPIKTNSTITYWLPINANVAGVKNNLGETEFGKNLEKQTGIKVKYIHPTQGQETEKFNLLCASGDLPDLIEYDWITFPGGPNKAIKDGTIIKLNDAIDKYAPNLKKFFKEHPDMEKVYKTDDGSFYMFPFVKNDPVLAVSYGPVMREDWLKELNLPVPTTMDEWETVLTAFKEKKGATAPLTFYLKEIFGGFAGAYGVNYGLSKNYSVENGQIKYGPIEPGFKEFVTTFNRWYKNGLLDKNFATVDKKIKASSMLTGKAGSTLAYCGAELGNWTTVMKDKDPNFKLIGVPYPSKNKGEKSRFGEKQFLATAHGVAISSKCKDIEAAVRYLDYGYSKEGADLYNFGTKDVSYKIEGSKVAYTELIKNNPNKLTMPQAMAMNMRTYSGPFIQKKEYIDEYYQIPQQKEAIKSWMETESEKYMLPFVTPLPQESAELSKIENEVATYTDEMFLKFVMGQEPIDNFDKYVATVQKMGIDKVLKIKQSAMERYNKR